MSSESDIPAHGTPEAGNLRLVLAKFGGQPTIVMMVPHSSHLSLITLFSLHFMAAIPNARPFVEFTIEEDGLAAATCSANSSAIVSEAEMAKDKAVYERLKRHPRMPGFNLRPAVGEEPRKMSHAWAVGGGKSTTGKPILESDPQLPLSSPPFFHEFHLAAGRIDARGLGIPGCPGLFIGWNRRIAWGASALGADSHVTFLDGLTPDGKGFLPRPRPAATGLWRRL